MSRVRETLQQEAGRQLPQGAGVHNAGGKPTSMMNKKTNPGHGGMKGRNKGSMRGR